MKFAIFLRTPFFTEHLRWLLPVLLLDVAYRISSNERRVSNKRRPLISVALLGIHIEISASL